MKKNSAFSSYQWNFSSHFLSLSPLPPSPARRLAQLMVPCLKVTKSLLSRLSRWFVYLSLILYIDNHIYRETGTGMYYQVTCLLLTNPQLRSAIASRELLSETECVGIVNDLRANPPTPEPENLDEKCKVSVRQDGCSMFLSWLSSPWNIVINVNYQSHIIDEVPFCRKAWRTSAAGEDCRIYNVDGDVFIHNI